MPFTRMPLAAHSVASVPVRPARPGVDAPQGAAPGGAGADARAPPIPRDAPVTAATLPSSEKSSGSMPGLSYIRAPAAEFRDVGGLRRAMSFAYESRHFSTILQFDLADPQRRGNARHERTERFRGESPDLDLDRRAAAR